MACLPSGCQFGVFKKTLSQQGMRYFNECDVLVYITMLSN